MKVKQSQILTVTLLEDGNFKIWIDNRLNYHEDWGWIVGQMVEAIANESGASIDEVTQKMQNGLVKFFQKGSLKKKTKN